MINALPVKQMMKNAFLENHIFTEYNLIISVQSSNFENIAELDRKIEEFIMKQSDGSYQCTTCGKISKAKKDIKEHVEVHFDGLSFPCRYCDKSFRSRASLRVHTNKKICTINI